MPGFLFDLVWTLPTLAGLMSELSRISPGNWRTGRGLREDFHFHSLGFVSRTKNGPLFFFFFCMEDRSLHFVFAWIPTDMDLPLEGSGADGLGSFNSPVDR